MLAYEKQIEENGGLAPYKEFDDVLDVDELMEILWAYAQKLGLEDVLPSGRYYDIYEDQGAVYSYQICFYEHADGLPVVTLKGEQPVFLRAKVLYGRLVEVQYTPPALERYSFDNRYAPLDVHGALEHLNYYNQSNTFYSYETPPLNPKAYATLTEAYPVLALQYWCTQQARPNGTIYHHDYYYVPAWCFTFHTAHDPNAYMYAYVNALTGEPFLQPESGSVHFAPKEDKGS